MADGIRNGHKLNEMNKRVKEKDIAILLESGINDARKTPSVHDELVVDTEHKMDKVLNYQY